MSVSFTSPIQIGAPTLAPIAANSSVTRTVWGVKAVADIHEYSPYPPSIAALEGTPDCANTDVTRGNTPDDTWWFYTDDFGNWTFYHSSSP
ncbi:MAG: hypothetical protein ACYDB7_10245 [Mycobacteriales bacterium]